MKLSEDEYMRDEISRGTQSWTRQAPVRWNGHKLRATVKRDCYDFQSQLHVDVWSDTELAWHRVQTLSGVDYKDLPSYVVQDEVKLLAATSPIITELLDYAKEILI